MRAFKMAMEDKISYLKALNLSARLVYKNGNASLLRFVSDNLDYAVPIFYKYYVLSNSTNKSKPDPYVPLFDFFVWLRS